jgi:hypothetical protein
LDYGDDGPPEFHDESMLKEVNLVLPLPIGATILPVHKVKLKLKSSATAVVFIISKKCDPQLAELYPLWAPRWTVRRELPLGFIFATDRIKQVRQIFAQLPHHCLGVNRKLPDL